MKVLFVMNDDFPYCGACTSLLNNMLLEGKLVEKFDSVDVLTCKYRYDDMLEGQSFHGVEIFRYLSIDRLPGSSIKKALHDNKMIGVQLLLHKVAYRVLKTIKNTYKDYDEIMSIIRTIMHIDKGQYDVIIPICGNFNIALGVLEYKKKSKSSTKVLIYQVDPCANNEAENDKTLSEREIIEKRCINEADAIITTPILEQYIKNRYNGLNKKITTMEFPNVSYFENRESKSDSINCVFAGSIYRNIRNPEYAFKLFGSIDENIRLILIGVDKEKQYKDISNRIVFQGKQSLEDTRNSLVSADFLVNIGNVMTNQVPSKIFEYISYGKPIINIYKNVNCPSLRYLERYPLVLNVFEDPNCITENREKVKKFIADNRGKHVERKIIEDLFYDCTPVFCANKMLSFFSDVLQSNSI